MIGSPADCMSCGHLGRSPYRGVIDVERRGYFGSPQSGGNYGEPITAAVAGIVAGSIAAAGAITTAVITGAQNKRERAELMLAQQQAERHALVLARQQEAAQIRVVQAQSTMGRDLLLYGTAATILLGAFGFVAWRRRRA